MIIFDTVNPDMEQIQTDVKQNQFGESSRGNVTNNAKLESSFLFPGDQSDEGAQMDVISQGPMELTYACVMIPRFADHYLTGDITLSLPVWMKEICISYGWRLEGIVIRPGYIHWLIAVPLAASPAQIIRIIRRHTSQKILSEFPRYKQQNLAGDFWAPGCSFAMGSQMQDQEAINSFIHETRKQQGF